MTVLFYSAVHYVIAYFWERHGRSHKRHEDRRRDMEKEPELASILDAYDEPYDWSRDARYISTPRFDPLDLQQARDDGELIATTITQLIS